MGLILVKQGRRLEYRPFPKEDPSIVLYHFRLDEAKQKMLREQCGKQFFNKTTGKMDFEVTDEQKFDALMRDNVLAGWSRNAFFHDDGEHTPYDSESKEDRDEVYAIMPQWIKRELILRGAGLDPMADVENLLVHTEVDQASKNS